MKAAGRGPSSHLQHRGPELALALALSLALALALNASQPPGSPPGSTIGTTKALRAPDVHYEPTPQPVVREMLRLAEVGPADLVYDLGSGDGRIPITAAREFGARGSASTSTRSAFARQRRTPEPPASPTA